MAVKIFPSKGLTMTLMMMMMMVNLEKSQNRIVTIITFLFYEEYFYFPCSVLFSRPDIPVMSGFRHIILDYNDQAWMIEHCR